MLAKTIQPTVANSRGCNGKDCDTRVMARSVILFTVIALACVSCRRERSDAPAPAMSASTASTAPTAPTAPRVLVPVPVPAGVARCGELDCLSFADSSSTAGAVAAFRYVLAHEPRVLGLGEAHAQKGSEAIASSTKRFTEALLPELQGKTAGLVLELWLGEPKCGKVVEVVREQQKPVTRTQAKTNPNEIVALGDRAFALGIRPYPLRPSCEDYAPIADAGADGVRKMLELIERLSEERMKSLLALGTDAGAMVVGYGGALHNDALPAPGKEGFSFGPAMTHATNGRYIELDLIVGNFVRDEAPWTSLPWVKPYLARARDQTTLLYRPGPASFVLVFH